MKTTKNDSEKTTRRIAEQTVDLFLDVLLTNEDGLAWEGMGLIGRLVDFKGQLPQSSGFSGFCTLARRVDRMRHWSECHRMSLIVLRKLSDRQREAVCFDRAYRGRTKVAVDPFTPTKKVEIYWGDNECARQLDCSVNAFRKRVQEGYQSIEQILNEKAAQAA
ncbi:hypothetical protein [Marinobacter sp. BGYM27]|uniref:hypothetical protein n=1 Tax=Marinobacter sp. BGYM27 TaxID=2975597 RepID=UPI0021A26348|nr:hypothetical protein [Marinobacter sp. BGYM27]MDG5498949.1 hypothetical protein [Marinobacter sp. BGYM27]